MATFQPQLPRRPATTEHAISQGIDISLDPLGPSRSTPSFTNGEEDSWLVFDPKQAASSGGYAEGWTSVAPAMPRHDGTGTFLEPSAINPIASAPSQSSRLASPDLAEAHNQNSVLDASLYAPRPRLSSVGSGGSGLSLPSDLSAPSSSSQRLAAESLQSSRPRVHSRGSASSFGSSSWTSGGLSSPTLDSQAGGESLTASALRQVPRGRSERLEAILTSGGSSGEDGEDEDVDERDLAWTPHAHSAGLRSSQARLRHIAQPTARREKSRSIASGGSGKVRHSRRKSRPRKSDDVGIKRSASGYKSATVPVATPVPSSANSSPGQVGPGFLARVATTVMDIDEETARMFYDAAFETKFPMHALVTPVSPRLRTRGISARRGSRSIVSQVQFSLNDSLMDLSGYYGPSYNTYQNGADSASGTETETETRTIPRSPLQSAITQSPKLATRAPPVVHRSLSLSSIPRLFLGALASGGSGSGDVQPGELRRSSSVLWPRPGPERAGAAEGVEAVGSREEAIGYWRRVLMSWAGW